jgi:hypothetical protein
MSLFVRPSVLLFTFQKLNGFRYNFVWIKSVMEALGKINCSLYECNNTLHEAYCFCVTGVTSNSVPSSVTVGTIRREMPTGSVGPPFSLLLGLCFRS